MSSIPKKTSPVANSDWSFILRISFADAPKPTSIPPDLLALSPELTLESYLASLPPPAKAFWVSHVFPCGTKINAPALTPQGLADLLCAIGTGTLRPRTETMEEFIARGGQITLCPPRHAEGADHRQSPKRVEKVSESAKKLRKIDIRELSIDDLLSGL